MYLNKIGLLSKLLIIVTVVSCAYSDTNVPVFIWGSSSLSTTTSLSPLAHIEKDQFSNELNNILKKEVSVLVFVEEKLSPEDFQCTNNGASCFKNSLKSATDSVYFPSVENPVGVLQSKPNVEIVNLDSKGASKDRQQQLAEHDALIQEKLDSFQKTNKEYVAVFTAKLPSLNVEANRRAVRDTDPAAPKVENAPVVLNISGKVLFSYSELVLFEKDDTAGTVLTISDTDLVDKTNMDLGIYVYEVIVSDGTNKVNLTINGKSGYWSVSGVVLKDKSGEYPARTSVDISGINGFSFHCNPVTQLTAFNGEAKITLKDFQFQPFFGKALEVVRFGESLDCVGFMSAPILAGLFVTFMLAAIVAIGICMMMDLKTMDRFEDAKGKTITVTATE